MKSFSVTIQMAASTDCSSSTFPVVLFITLYNEVILTFFLFAKSSIVKIQLKATEQYFPVVFLATSHFEEIFNSPDLRFFSQYDPIACRGPGAFMSHHFERIFQAGSSRKSIGSEF